jgi:hypothetical protein
MRDMGQARKPVKLTAKSVFEVDHSRLGIGVFSRPLLDAECRNFQVDKSRVSFVASPERVPDAWNRIDSLLASATQNVKKAS